jgi:endonuclease YncB( thermonuclease family)
MFHFLHRLYVLSWIAVIVGGCTWLYVRLGVSEPLADWFQVFQNAYENGTKPMEHLSGKAVGVTDGTSFTLRTADHQVFSFGLLGLLPGTSNGKTDDALTRLSRQRLSELILSNDVEVLVASLDAQHRGLGIVHLGDTNVNALMLESGLVEFKREFIKGIPMREQYALIRADRKAREQKSNLSAQLEASHGPVAPPRTGVH